MLLYALTLASSVPTAPNRTSELKIEEAAKNPAANSELMVPVRITTMIEGEIDRTRLAEERKR